jgi:branched-chain amino acid transport system substrate-binding protein
MRDRVAIVFMTLSLVATLILGGAVVHELNRPAGSQVVAGTLTPGQSASSPGGGSATAAGTGTAATPGLPGTAGTAGTTGTAASAGTSGTAGAASTSGTSASSGGSTSSPSGSLTATPAVSAGGVITVGGIYDETGPFDATVERDTVRSYFDMINAQGGVNGYKFQLVECDSGYDPSVAHQCSQRLLSQKILAMVGWLSVSGEEAETQYLNGQGVPVIGGLGVPSEFTSSLSYPVTASVITSGKAMGTHAKDLGIHAPGIILLNANFISPAEQSLLNALHANGITQKYVDLVDPTKADYTDEAIKARTSNVDSLIVLLDPFSYARMFQALDRQNFHPKLLGFGLDKKSAEQQYGSAVYSAESLTPVLEPDQHMSQSEMALYYGSVQKYFPSQVPALDVYSETEWAAAKTFVDAVRRLGSTPLSRKSLVDSLNSIKNFDTGLTVPVSFSAGGSHDPNRCYQWIKNQSGTWATYSGWNCF